MQTESTHIVMSPYTCRILRNILEQFLVIAVVMLPHLIVSFDDDLAPQTYESA